MLLLPLVMALEEIPQEQLVPRSTVWLSPLSLSHSPALWLSTLCLHSHSHTLTCTYRYDEIKGTQDLKIYSHADSLILSLHSLALWLSGSPTLWLSGSLAHWLTGSLALWLSTLSGSLAF